MDRISGKKKTAENCGSCPVLTVNKLTHVWQAQQRGRYFLPLMRHPFCRYDYAVKPGLALERYGLEQQAEIVRHVFLLQNRCRVAGAPALDQLQTILPFATDAAANP